MMDGRGRANLFLRLLSRTHHTCIVSLLDLPYNVPSFRGLPFFSAFSLSFRSGSFVSRFHFSYLVGVCYWWVLVLAASFSFVVLDGGRMHVFVTKLRGKVVRG